MKRELNLSKLPGGSSYWSSVGKPRVESHLKKINADLRTRAVIIKIEKAVSFFRNKVNIGSSWLWVVNHDKYEATQKELNRISGTDTWIEYSNLMYGEVRKELREFL